MTHEENLPKGAELVALATSGGSSTIDAVGSYLIDPTTGKFSAIIVADGVATGSITGADIINSTGGKGARALFPLRNSVHIRDERGFEANAYRRHYFWISGKRVFMLPIHIASKSSFPMLSAQVTVP